MERLIAGQSMHRHAQVFINEDTDLNTQLFHVHDLIAGSLLPATAQHAIQTPSAASGKGKLDAL
jgi:hypothetical protein